MNETKRIKRLQELIERINSGGDVARRDLKSVLTNEEWDAYEASVVQQREFKGMLADVPHELLEYIKRLKRADFLYARAETMHPKGNARTRTSLYHRAESAYENAIGYLAEIIAKKPNTQMWLDRPFNQQPEKSCSLDPSNIPRLITSASLNQQTGIKALVGDRRSLKLSALQNSLANIQTGKEMQNPETTGITLPKQATKHVGELNFD